MSGFDGCSFQADEFSGRVRLLTVPGLIMFPHVIQPLHIRQTYHFDLVRDAIEDDRLLAVPILGPDEKVDQPAHLPSSPLACLCQIAAVKPLGDGSQNVLLAGLRRLRLVRPFQARRSYLETKGEILEDGCPSIDECSVWIQDLRKSLQRILPCLPHLEEQLRLLLDADHLSLNVLTDVLGFALELPMKYRAELLAETDILARADRLLQYIEKMAASLEGESVSCLWYRSQFSPN